MNGKQVLLKICKLTQKSAKFVQLLHIQPYRPPFCAKQTKIRGVNHMSVLNNYNLQNAAARLFKARRRNSFNEKGLFLVLQKTLRQPLRYRFYCSDGFFYSLGGILNFFFGVIPAESEAHARSRGIFIEPHRKKHRRGL